MTLDVQNELDLNHRTSISKQYPKTNGSAPARIYRAGRKEKRESNSQIIYPNEDRH